MHPQKGPLGPLPSGQLQKSDPTSKAAPCGDIPDPTAVTFPAPQQCHSRPHSGAIPSPTAVPFPVPPRCHSRLPAGTEVGDPGPGGSGGAWRGRSHPGRAVREAAGSRWEEGSGHAAAGMDPDIPLCSIPGCRGCAGSLERKRRGAGLAEQPQPWAGRGWDCLGTLGPPVPSVPAFPDPNERLSSTPRSHSLQLPQPEIVGEILPGLGGGQGPPRPRGLWHPHLTFQRQMCVG